jgi:hypothetical protein
VSAERKCQDPLRPSNSGPLRLRRAGDDKQHPRRSCCRSASNLHRGIQQHEKSREIPGRCVFAFKSMRSHMRDLCS